MEQINPFEIFTTEYPALPYKKMFVFEDIFSDKRKMYLVFSWVKYTFDRSNFYLSCSKVMKMSKNVYYWGLKGTVFYFKYYEKYFALKKQTWTRVDPLLIATCVADQQSYLRGNSEHYSAYI